MEMDRNVLRLFSSQERHLSIVFHTQWAEIYISRERERKRVKGLLRRRNDDDIFSKNVLLYKQMNHEMYFSRT